MQDHPIDGLPHRGHRLNPREVAIDRAVLSALLADPSDTGQRVRTVARALGHPTDLVEDAIDFLVWLRVLDQNGPRVRASGATMYLAQLWDVTL